MLLPLYNVGLTPASEELKKMSAAPQESDSEEYEDVNETEEGGAEGTTGDTNDMPLD